MYTINPADVSTAELQVLLQSAIAPRPICFASTIDKNGTPNLSPFSFFNMFSTNPPVFIFSPARRVRDNTIKHTLENVYEVPEVVINMVNYDLVQQCSLSSTEYDKGVDEFVKSGLTPLSSDLVKPFRVKESPVQLECKVNQVIELAQTPGAGNLIICELLRMHVNPSVMDDRGRINQQKIDLVARLGGDWYCRASGPALFEVEKPVRTKGLGVDRIPERIRYSRYLTGNNLGQLGNTEQLPDTDDIEIYKKINLELAALMMEHLPHEELEQRTHILAKKYLDEGKVTEAWKILLAV
ncbi:MAG: flavin reductase family protein [Bacteroidia bacterium]|nr:flavin reductase family protein [Bacteroidia bacterium]MBP7260278.1 flavin reductase family protein [Bacteroidia bacterium]MBP9179333.1 flavin reductase family protein [Bacteroidia bacterium]MBP9724855.1 flavin reductase family protein [Bacteroidia bacterium]